VPSPRQAKKTIGRAKALASGANITHFCALRKVLEEMLHKHNERSLPFMPK
jgi:hypothetical protein